MQAAPLEDQASVSGIWLAGLAVNSSVAAAALNSVVRSNVTGIDSSSGGATLINSTQSSGAVDNRTRVLSGKLRSCPLPGALVK